MERVALDFCERVALATTTPPRGCAQFANKKWQKAVEVDRRPLHIDFTLIYAGTWNYAFHSNGSRREGRCSLQELKNNPDFKRIQLRAMEIYSESEFSNSYRAVKLEPLDVELETLLNTIAFLARYPRTLKINLKTPVDPADEAELFRCLETLNFEYIWIENYRRVYDTMVKRNIATRFSLDSRNWPPESLDMLEACISSGEMRDVRFYNNPPFPFALIEQICRNIEANQAKFRKTNLTITSEFERCARSTLEPFKQAAVNDQFWRWSVGDVRVNVSGVGGNELMVFTREAAS